MSEPWLPIPPDPSPECPNCGHATVVGASDETACENCGWDDMPRCPHGIREDEFCVLCPDGGV